MSALFSSSSFNQVLFFFNFLLFVFIELWFANIWHNTKSSSHQVSYSGLIIQLPQLPCHSPPFPQPFVYVAELGVSHGVSPSLIFSHSVPLLSFIIPFTISYILVLVKPCDDRPSRTDLLHFLSKAKCQSYKVLLLNKERADSYLLWASMYALISHHMYSDFYPPTHFPPLLIPCFSQPF